MWLAILCTVAIAYLTYYFCLKPYNYWKNRGIIYEIPVPLVGNFGSTLLRKKHVAEVNDYLYKKYANERCVGIFIFTRPALFIRDIELVRRICVEEFEHFCDRVNLFDKKIDTDVGNVVTNLTGPQWKETRHFLNPIFESSQVMETFDLISDFAEAFSAQLVKESETLVEIKLYDTFSKYENGIISSACFGAKNDDLFFKMHQSLKNFGAIEKLKLALIQLVPWLAKVLDIQVYPTSKTEFFKRIALEAIEKRESETSDRRDFIQHLIETRKRWSKQRRIGKEELNVKFAEDEVEKAKADDRKKEWTDEDIATQTLIFLNSHAGLEPLITACCSMAYELALNPDIQVKLQDEIDNVFQKSGKGKPSYHAVSSMQYLNCVVSESLRKWPPIYQVDRQCMKNYFEVDLPIPDDEKLVIEKGTAVIIPIMAIHRDRNYFPDPLRFNPERFNAQNRGDIIPGTYIPFGSGPRKCIGSHFALLQMKMVFFHMLSKFDLVPTNNTTTHLDAHPFKFDKPSATCTVLGLKPRRVTSL